MQRHFPQYKSYKRFGLAVPVSHPIQLSPRAVLHFNKRFSLFQRFKMSKKDWVELQIKSNKVVVFSKSYCPFCKKTKNALKDCGLEDYLVFELDERDDGDEIFDILRGITGGRTVSFVVFPYPEFHFIKFRIKY